MTPLERSQEALVSRRRLSQAEIQQIRLIWAENPKQSGVQVWRRFGENKTSLRKVQLIVAEAKAASTDRPFDVREWKPWDDSSESSDDSAFLLRMAAVCEATKQRRFTIVEAYWAKRLRVALEGLTSFEKFRFVELYSVREFIAHILGEPSPHTADLDGILAYRPWVPENRESYDVALNLGNVPTWAIYFESGEHKYVTWSDRKVKFDIWVKIALTFGLVPPEGLHIPQIE